jgi:hypothetical protein
MRAVDKFSYNEQPNILGAIAQWDDEAQRSYANASHLNQRDLSTVPAFAIDQNRKMPVPPLTYSLAKTQYNYGSGRQCQIHAPPAQQDNTPPTSNQTQGKKQAKKACIYCCAIKILC